ncbi:hypothetical protein PCK2_000776 [Pneumocystis canis]|nr:hypothetical protein PCK2_000776 [Pneumocystis canis]
MATLRSVYHVRQFEVSKLLNIPETTPIDIFLSHDWPRGIEKYGDWKKLLSKKPYFLNDIQNNCLGSLPNEYLMNKLQPTYWFSAHLHVKFEAMKIHHVSENASEDLKNEIKRIVKNPDEIDLEDDTEDKPDGDAIDLQRNLNNEKGLSHKVTRFLALDKCLPGRHFLEILDIPAPVDDTNETLKLSYDIDWLAICRVFHPYFSVEYDQIPIPEDEAYLARLTMTREIEKEKAWVQEHIVHSYGLEIPLHFEHTAPVEESVSSIHNPPPVYNNPQTQAFCKIIKSSKNNSFSFSKVSSRVILSSMPCNPSKRSLLRFRLAIFCSARVREPFENHESENDHIHPDEVHKFPSTCPSCTKSCDTNMKLINIPYFKEVIIMCTVCDHCGYKTNEVKTGGEIPEKGKKITLKVENIDDLFRDLLKSETCSITIPELNLNLYPGTLGGRFTTLEGLSLLLKKN